METIILELPEHLAAEVRKHQAEMPQVIEWGLERLKAEERETPETPEAQRARALEEHERTIQVLVASGLVEPPTYDPEAIKRHDHPPIEVGGKPASEMIIEDRGPL